MENSPKAMDCRFCHSKNISNQGNIANGRYAKKFLKDYSLIRCSNCSSAFISPVPNDEVLSFIYSNPQYSAWETSLEKENNIRYINFKHYLKKIKKYVDKGVLLDCGCATGYFLDVAKENNFDCYGTEISEIPFKIAETKHPDRIFKKNVEDLNVSDETYDIITMFDFIEHVKNPEKTLQKASDLIKKNGYLIITTPNTRSLSMASFGKKHTNYILEHINLFNHKFLSKYFENFGFKVISIAPAKKILTLKYAENVFRVHDNFLYKPVRIINSLLPKRVTRFPLKVSFGDMFVIAQKK